MAYITTSNLKQIICQSDFTSLSLKGGLYKTSIYFFSKFEEASLLAVKELLRDPEQYFLKYYRPITQKQTPGNVVFENTTPAYHLNSACERLNADYKNVRIPQSISVAGFKAVQDYKEWCKANRELLYSNNPAFIARHQLRWGMSPIGIEMLNTGSAEVDNYTIEGLETKIDTLLQQAKDHYYRDSKTNVILKKYSKYTYLAKKPDPIYNNNTGFSDSEVKAILRDYDARFKAPLKNLLIEYYRLTLNPEIRMEGYLLEQLNFKPCSCCAGKKNVTSFSFADATPATSY